MRELVYERRTTRPDAVLPQRRVNVVTDVVPIDESRDWPESAFGPCNPFSTESQVLEAPELDDLNDLGIERPRLLIAPRPNQHRSVISGPLVDGREASARQTTSAGTRRATAATHRKKSGATGVMHSRLIIAAIAAGAVAAGATVGVDVEETRSDQVLLADTESSQGYAPGASGLQIVQVASNVDAAVHREEFANGSAFAQERAQREARLQRPQFVFPARGILTSGFGTRWGTLHGGLDIANAIGTPIYAASDGEVIASGPTPGYGMWVKIRDANGTVTLYGHIDTATVQVGDRVLAGDQIATMGNRGNSTGPHLHFEVHLNEAEKADPMSWLRARGVPSA